VYDAAHDRLGKDVEQVGAHRQDALDAGAHQGRSDDEAAAGPDAAGDQAGDQADPDGGEEDEGSVEGRRVGRFAAQHARQRPGRIRKGNASQDDGNQQQAENNHPFAVPQYSV
jgi:hypothetical protein